MPYHIYETQAFILSDAPSRETDKYYALFTRQFGLIYAAAKGVRELKSKLRYSLQPYSHSVVFLVHGHSGWRITGARLEENYFTFMKGDNGRLVILARVRLLLRRLLQGQEKNTELFDSLIKGVSFLKEVSASSLPDAELLLVLRILSHLGYIGDIPTITVLLTEGFWSPKALAEASRMRSILVRSVNESLRASHL